MKQYTYKILFRFSQSDDLARLDLRQIQPACKTSGKNYSDEQRWGMQLQVRTAIASLLDLTLSRLKWCGIGSIVLAVSKVEQMESELRKLSQAELRQIREWLDDFIEDELEFTAEFENSIQQSGAF